MRNYFHLDVWKESHTFTLAIYQTTRSFPDTERCGLVNQMRRAATSIPANIAEGAGRHGNAEFTRFLHNAAGSASETEYYLLLARDLAYLDDASYRVLSEQVVRIKKMLVTLARKSAK